jgi:hypothetical protein
VGAQEVGQLIFCEFSGKLSDWATVQSDIKCFLGNKSFWFWSRILVDFQVFLAERAESSF